MAHPDKNPTRDAYHSAIADVAIDTARRASGIVASPPYSDRSAFHPLPALVSVQFSAVVVTHRLAKISHTPLRRSPATPSTAKGWAAPVPARRLLPTIPRIPPLSLLDSAEPFSPVPHLLSATDTFPDDTPTRLQPQPAEDWCFSAIEDGDSSDDSAPGFFAPTALLVGGVQAIPTMNAAAAAGHPSAAFFLHTPYDPARAADSHPGARAGGESESHFSTTPRGGRTAIPQLFPQQFRSSSAAVPQQFRSSSAAAPQQLRSSSAAAPQQLRSSSAAAPRQLRSSPAAAPQQLRSRPTPS